MEEKVKAKTSTEVRTIHVKWCYPKPEKQLCDFEKGYIAGIIDGEGNIRIIKSKPGKRSKYLTLSPQISIKNCSKELMQKCRGILEIGKISLYRYKTRISKKWRPCYELRVIRLNEVLWLLENIGEHLIVKKRQAHLLLEFLNLRRKATRTMVVDRTSKKIVAQKGSGYTKRALEIFEEIKTGYVRKI